MQTRCLELIQQGYTLVAASARLASRIRHDYAGHMVQSGKTAWESPDVLPLQAWFTRCWEAQQLLVRDGRILINAVQQRCLWQEIIQASAHSRDLLQINPVIDQAMQAYELCRCWLIPVFPDSVYLNPDVRAFRSWVDLYTKRLDKERWIDVAGVVDALCQDPGGIDTDKIVFYGFDELTPQQQKLADALRNYGTEVVILEPEPRNADTRYLRMNDPGDEIRSAALWARQILNRDPQASIGIIVPSLQSQRQNVETLFDQVLHPERLVTATNITERYYSIALGRPLSGYPLVHVAMEILGLGHDTRTVNQYGALLRSPFIKDADTEANTRAQMELDLRCSGELDWHLANLVRYVESQCGEPALAGRFLDLLKGFARTFRATPAQQNPRQWAETVANWLQDFGWPGQRPLNSSEFQQLDAWQAALNSLASLGSILKRCNYPTALNQLSQILTRTSFQPESAETPIQISALPGAAAMQYDYLWVTGMHDQVWPAPAQPNPFIPLSLQREAGLPGSSAEVCHRSALALTEGMVASAGEVIFSYPVQDGDRECRPSPLLFRYMVDADEPVIEATDDYQRIIHRSATLETLTDSIAPAVSLQEKSAGGSGIFKDQAACGFRAFARHRLYAEGPAVVNVGLDPAVRGQLVHRTLQLLWHRMQTSATLQRMSDTELDQIITDVVEQAIRSYQPQYPESFTARFTAIEAGRLRSMARDWLVLERDRPPFTVQGLEQKHTVSLEGLQVNLRTDRIDVLADGRLVILDYKTGKVNIKDWEGERPDNPQLPLYAVSRESDPSTTLRAGVAAIAFACLKQGEYRFAGLAADDGLLPGVTTDPATPFWGDKLQEWKTVLKRLAREFLDGRAAVDPKNSQTCRYCDLHTFCRIYEVRTTDAVNEYED